MKLYKEGSRAIKGVSGSLLFVEGLRGGYGERVSIDTGMETRPGQIVRVENDRCVVHVFEGTAGLDTGCLTAWLDRDVAKVAVGEQLKGRILNGFGDPDEGGSLTVFDESLSIEGPHLPPTLLTHSDSYIETGISSIDLMCTLFKGQKMALLAPSGLPLHEYLTRLIRSVPVFVVFAAIGLNEKDAYYYKDIFQKSGDFSDGVMVLSKASASAAERLSTPRVALTVGEYFAFSKGLDVLVVMTDMLAYVEAWKEINAELDIRHDGFSLTPLRNDLASLYERSGCLAGRGGSLTLLPVMRNFDNGSPHPVTEVSASLLEGQIVLSRLHEVDVLASRSHRIATRAGRGCTFGAHRFLAEQLYASYAKSCSVYRRYRTLGDTPLDDTEKCYLKFKERFETRFVSQEERRSLAQSESVAWEVLEELPPLELYFLPEHLRKRAAWDRSVLNESASDRNVLNK